MTSTQPSDLDIARAATLRPIQEVAAEHLGLEPTDLEPYGHHKAKVRLEPERLAGQRQGKLILVTAVSPTPAGEGKTTTTVGLGDALNRLGKRTSICLREPSLGPCFGVKGGAAGGGHAQVVPMEDINLHFTGDFHAITSAHNLLAAALDNHLHHGNELGLDPRRIQWTRVLDLNERALRDVVVGLGGRGNSVPRETGFEITAASEVMAIFALAEDLADLKARLGRIVVGQTYDQQPVTAADLKVHGAMAALLRDALAPNLVQTLEGNPAFVHAGPFGNIAHGCNSVVATRHSLALSDYTVTEAGFGADLGAEKFFDIKCRSAGLRPDCSVLVATVRALKHQGGAPLSLLTEPDQEALERGLDHLEKHVENLRRYGVPVVICVNAFTSDRAEEIELLLAASDRLGAPVVRSDHWARGGDGATDLGEAVIAAVEAGTADFHPLYPDHLGLLAKVRRIAREIYGADDIIADTRLRARFKQLEEEGHGELPVCIAKTQMSFSTDPKLLGRPRDFDVPLRDVVLKSGAGFVLVLAGSILTMPGLPRRPSAEKIDLDDEGQIVGLF